MNDLITETVALVRDRLDEARIVVQLELAAQLPVVAAHRGQLQQVVLNVITNAVDAMRAVTDRPRILSLQSRTFEPCNVAISVQDSGAGIDPKNIDRIFDAFFTTKDSGMGLGLALCRSIVEAHGGTLTASAGAPHGAVFQIILPAR
jgi:signal transduction histidine kinase